MLCRLFFLRGGEKPSQHTLSTVVYWRYIPLIRQFARLAKKTCRRYHLQDVR
jgi:hypothetical protein